MKLTECYRQADSEFSRILDRIRVGDASDREELNEKCLRPGPGLTLFPRNREADALNDREFRALGGDAQTWGATDAVCQFQEADDIWPANSRRRISYPTGSKTSWRLMRYDSRSGVAC